MEAIILLIIGAVLAFAIGIYIGLGMPGVPGRGDRVVSENLPRRRNNKIRYLDWLRPPEQPRT